MLQPKQSPAKQVTYDSGDAKLQWRCHLHMLHKPPSLITIAVWSLILMAVTKLPPISIIGFALAIFALCLLQAKVSIDKRAKGPRICTTTISEEGLSDQTPDSSRTLAWSQVKNIEESEGDIYFFTLTGGGFIPKSAFNDDQSARAFLAHALGLWHAGRKEKERNLMNLSSSNDKGLAPGALKPEAANKAPTPEAEDPLAEDQSVWNALEAEHKKQNAPNTGPDNGDQNMNSQAKE